MKATRAFMGLGLALSAACAEGVEGTSSTFNPSMPTTATISGGVSGSEPGTDGSVTGTGSDDGGGGGVTGSPTAPMSSDSAPMTSGSEPICGDGMLGVGEECDGSDLAGKTCESFGWEAGTLACNPDCTFFADACYRCGDGVKDMAEACDGADLDGRTCATEGFGGGALKCRVDCKGVDTSGCTPLATCGNGQKEGSEQCDGAQLGGQTCTGLGFDQGTLACTGSCTLDTSGCMALDCAGQGEVCLFDQNNLQSNCCPPGVKGNVLGICDLLVCL